ncbi:sulfatase family protein [Galbibacter mesophilus]|uniref:sulfatase family protein n=1 Tax=Galbibacter mesophilus TaxID=379069 RepID=UPI00191EB17A|nr:sulfatase-like hydrolase/transferase [Galbibacter mesophilus]MCM5662554.1 sulfatase-like hydrolase/transferase [Galbibacter mesophilus]
MKTIKKLFLICVFCNISVIAAQVRPNILLICTDDQGYHDVSYYGTEDIETPNIDGIALNGIRFDNFYANSSVCSPTRASLLSGTYPSYVGVPGVIRTDSENSWGYLSDNFPLLPSQLKKVGYNTAIVGKWHLGLESPNLPNEKGFDFFKGWIGDMMDDYWEHKRHGINYMRFNSKEINPKGHATDLFTDWAISYIQEQKKNDNPFFLYLAYNAPHFPVQPPKEWLEKVTEREKPIDSTRAKLVAFIEHMDDGIGKVIKALKTSGQYENTIIIFTSDNGGHLPSMANNGPLRDGKGTMYEGGLRVPTCISWDGVIAPNRISENVHLSMDVYPTLLDMVGLSAPKKIEGESFYKEILNKEDYTPNEERLLYFVRREGRSAYGGKAIMALRKGDWKLLQNNPYRPLELYNLKNDPLEQTNLLNKYPDTVKYLQRELMKIYQKEGAVPWQK